MNVYILKVGKWKIFIRRIKKWIKKELSVNEIFKQYKSVENENNRNA